MTPDPLARAVAGFRALEPPDRPPDAAVLARLTPGTPARSLRRRRVMTRAALFAVAASILAAGFLLVGGSAVTLAGMVQAAERHALVRYRCNLRWETKADPTPADDGAIFYDDLRSPRTRYDRRIFPIQDLMVIDQTWVVDHAKDRTLTLLHEYAVPIDKVPPGRRAEHDGLPKDLPRHRAQLTEAVPDEINPWADVKRPFLDRLRALAAHPKANRRPAPAFGAKVAVFRIEDGPRTTELWLDESTRLPVKWVSELLVAQAGETYLWTFSDFEWDPKLPDGVKSLDELFSVVPPARYTLTDKTDKK